jgi:hypothetical protein
MVTREVGTGLHFPKSRSGGRPARFLSSSDERVRSASEGGRVTSGVIGRLSLPTTTSSMAAAPAPAQLTPKRQALKDAGDALFREKDYEGALKKYDAAILLVERAELHPGVENAVLYSNKAACELALKRCALRSILPTAPAYGFRWGQVA